MRTELRVRQCRSATCAAETGPAGMGKDCRLRLCPAAPDCLLKPWQSPQCLLRCHRGGAWCPAASKPVTRASVNKMSSASRSRRPQKRPRPWTGGGGPQGRLGGSAKRSRRRSAAHCPRRRSQDERVHDGDDQGHVWRLRTSARRLPLRRDRGPGWTVDTCVRSDPLTQGKSLSPS